MELYTSDLILKTVTDDDIEEVSRMWNYEKGSISTEEAKKAINYMQDNHNRNRSGCIYHLCFAIYEKSKDTIIGWCGLDGKTPGKLHIFYSIHSIYRNKGYATQCGEKLLSYAFTEAQVPFVNGGCDKNNIASYKVMGKIGMINDGYEENGDPLFYINHEMYHAKASHNSQ